MKIKFYGEVKDRFGKEVSLSITKNDNIARCIDCIKPGFLKYVLESMRSGVEFFIYSPDLDKVVFPEDLPEINDKTLDFLVQPQGSLAGAGAMLGGMVQSFAITWLTNKLNKKAKGKKKYERVSTNSYIYNQNKNLVEQGSAIPAGYGQLRIGTKTISSSVRNYDFDWKTTQIYPQALTELDKFNFGANSYLENITSDALDSDYYEKESYNLSDSTRRIVRIGSDGAQVPDAKLGNARPNSSSNNNQNGSDGSQVTEIISAGNTETQGGRVGFSNSSSAVMPAKPSALSSNSQPYEYSFRPNESNNPTVRIADCEIVDSKYQKLGGSSWSDLAPYNSVGNRGEWSTIGKGKLESISLHRSVELLCEGPIAGLSLPITGNEYQGQQVYPEPVGGSISSSAFNRRGSTKHLLWNNVGGLHSTQSNNTVEILNGGYGYEAGNVYEGSTKSIADMIEVDPPNDSSPARIPSFNGNVMNKLGSVYYGAIYSYSNTLGEIDFITDGSANWFDSFESYISPTAGVKIKSYMDSSLGALESYKIHSTSDNINIIKKDFFNGNGYDANGGNVRFTVSPTQIQATLGSGISPNGSEIDSDQGPTAQILDADRRRCRAEPADFANASHKELVSAIKQKQNMASFSADLKDTFVMASENDSTCPAYTNPYTTSDEAANIGAASDEVARIVPDSFADELTTALKAQTITFKVGSYKNAGCNKTTVTVNFSATVGQILNCFESDFDLDSKTTKSWGGTYWAGYSSSSYNKGCGMGQTKTKNPSHEVLFGLAANLSGSMADALRDNASWCAEIKSQLEDKLGSARFNNYSSWLFYGVGSGSDYRANYNDAACIGGLNTFSNLHIAKDGSNPLDYTPNVRGFYTPNIFPRAQVYILRRYTEAFSGGEPRDYLHIVPTVIEAVASVNSSGKVTSYHLIKVPNNPVIDHKILTRDADEYRTNPNYARTPIWPHAKMTKVLADEVKSRQPDYIESLTYQDLGVIIQTDDSRASVKELIFAAELNSDKTLHKLSGAATIWDKFGGSFSNFMHFGGTYDATATTLTPSHYAAAVGDTYKTFTTWQGAGFGSSSTISVEEERAIDPDTEDFYDPITASLSAESIIINTSTADASKLNNAYRRDGLESIIGSSTSASIKTGRIDDFSVNNANNATDFRYKKNLPDGTTVSTTFVMQPTIGISPSSGDEIKKFDITNKGQGYRPDPDTIPGATTKFIVYGRPQSLDTTTKRKDAVAAAFGCSVSDDICDEVFAYTFKAVVSINEKGQVNRISVIDPGFAFDDETGNPLPITIESLDHLSPGASTQLGNHNNFIIDEENNAFMDPAVHWNSSRVLSTGLVAKATEDFVAQGSINSNGKINEVSIIQKGQCFTLLDQFDVQLNTLVSSGATVPAFEAPEFSVVVDSTNKTITSITITDNGSGYGPLDTLISLKLPKPTAVNTATSTPNPVDSLSWASCVYLNEVPIRDKYGRFNFSKFDIDLKTGNIRNGSNQNQARFISYHKTAGDTASDPTSQLLRNEYRLPLQTNNVDYPLYGPRNQGEKDYFFSYDLKNRNVTAVVLSINIEKLFYIYEGDSETVYVNFAPALFGALGFFLGQKLGEALLDSIFSAIMPDVGMTGPGTFSGCVSGPTTPQPQIGYSPWNALGVGAKVAKFFVTTAFSLAGMALGHILGQKVPCSTMKFLCIKVGNKIENSGEYWPARVEIGVEYFLEGQPQVTRKLIQFNGIATSNYVRDIIIDDLPAASGDDQNRVIRVFRVTREMDPVLGGEKEARYNMSATLQSITEVIEGVFNYPHTALVASRTNSKDFSSIPNKEYLLKLKKVRIPSNYSPEVSMDVIEATSPNLDAMYDGNWDGKFKQHSSLGSGGSTADSNQGFFWTNNPAWVIYDLITDKTFGAGKYGINPESVDKWSFYKFAQRCDELVDVAVGNTTEKEKRHTCNLYIDTEQNAYELVNTLLDNYNADLHWSAGEVFITQDAPSTEVMMFTNANVSEQGFSYSTTEATTRYTACAVDYIDEKDNYRKKTEYVEDFEGIRDIGYSKLSLTAAGVTRRGEAHRLAWHKLLTYQTEKEIVSFEAGLEASYLRPGDIIKVMDNKRIANHSGGRILRINAANDIELDVPATALGSATSILIQRPIQSTDLTNDGISDSSEIADYRKAQFEEYSLIGSSGFSVTLGSNLHANIKEGYVWMIKENVSGGNAGTIKPANFKVKSITEKDGLKFDIHAIEHQNEKYDAVDKSSASTGENFTARDYDGHVIIV